MIATLRSRGRPHTPLPRIHPAQPFQKAGRGAAIPPRASGLRFGTAFRPQQAVADNPHTTHYLVPAEFYWVTDGMGLPTIDGEIADEDMAHMASNIVRATNFMKALGNESRMMILCHLASGEKSVSDLERLLSSRQSAVSQQLGRLRLEGIVEPRREGKAIYYSISDPKARQMMDLLYDMFCARG